MNSLEKSMLHDNLFALRKTKKGKKGETLRKARPDDRMTSESER